MTPSKVRSRSSRDASARATAAVGAGASRGSRGRRGGSRGFARKSRPSRGRFGARRWSESCRPVSSSTSAPANPRRQDGIRRRRAVDELRRRSCSALWMARAVWSSRTLLEAATTASGAPLVTAAAARCRAGHHAEHPPVEVVRQLRKLSVLCQSSGLGALPAPRYRAGSGSSTRSSCSDMPAQGPGRLPRRRPCRHRRLHQLELARVRVPVLSVQRTVSCPVLYRRQPLDRTPCAVRARAPRVRLRVTMAAAARA